MINCLPALLQMCAGGFWW